MQEPEEVCTDDEEPGYFVRITGFSTQTTEDALLNFFENTRRSGGGEIKDYQLRLEEGIADITFCSNKVAERVAQKGNWTLDGANMTITLKEIPKELPVDERCLHVMGVSNKTTEDGLISYMEVVSGEEVESIHFENTSHAMVTFKEPPDFDKLLGKCSKKTLDGCLLMVEQVKISDCIEVTGLAPITTKDTIYYYFQNSRNGGGDLKEMEYVKETGRALVFFEDPSVVDSVTKQDHVIDGAHLTVNRYYPFLGETSVARPGVGEKKERIVSVNPQSMLFIKEFFQQEFDQLLQEHRVKYTWQEGSGEIVLGYVEPKMDNATWENSCEAVVSYISQIVTEKINTTQEIWEQMCDKAKEKGVAFENEIQILHTFDFKRKDPFIMLRGKKTSVGVLAKQLYDLVSQTEKQILLEKSKITKKIKLSEAQMDLISYCGFLEDLEAKHQGLEVTMINDSDDQAIQLRGQEDEVNEGNFTVWQALSKVKESKIELPKSAFGNLCSETGKVSIATNFKKNNIRAVVGFDSRSETIMVTAVDKDNIKNAIEVIKDMTKKDAERMSGTESLDGSTLKSIPIDPKKFHVMGISDTTTKDGLLSFIELISGREVESMHFGSNSNVMVTFKEPADLESVLKKCSTRALDGSNLKIQQVNICDCIEVSGLAPNTTKDTVFFYFDNPRNGGGEVKSVEMDLEGRRALVFFADPSVVHNVMVQEHIINGAKLTVVPYYHFLGETSTDPGGGKKEKPVKVDPQAMVFIEKFFQQEFDQLLQEHRVKYTWQEVSGEIVLGCAEPKMDKTTWENSCEAVVSYINQIVTEKITISSDAWKNLCENVKGKCASFKDRVNKTCRVKERSFALTGKKSDVSVLAEHLNDLNSEIEIQIQYKKSKITKNIAVTEVQFELLSLSGFAEDLRGRFKDLEVTMSSKDLAISFRGPDSVVREGNISVWQTLSKIKEAEIELPKSIGGIVGSDAGKVFMATQFKKAYIDAVVSLDPNNGTQLMVTAVDRKDVKKAVDLIKDLTSEQSIHLDANQKQLLLTEKWKKLEQSIHQSMLLRVIEDPVASTLWIAGIKEEVENAKEKVERFFEENIILNKVIEAENGRVRFIFKYKRDALKNMEQSLRNHQVTLKSGEEYQLVVSGTREGIWQAIPKVKKLIDDIKNRRVELELPGMKKLFIEKKGITLLTFVENERNCIIERCTTKSNVPLSESTFWDTPASSYASECNMWLQIFAANNNDLDKAETDIKEIMKDHLKTKEIEYKAIGKLSDAQRERVMRMEGKHHTKIQIDKRINRIVVRGVSEDVSTATLAIYEILNEKSEEEHSRKYAELSSKNVQWYYSSDEGNKPYDVKTNAKIEHAYRDKKTCVIVLLNEEDDEESTRYKIDFPSMSETNLDTGETITAERKEATSGISLPLHWDPQPTDADGKELDVHLVPLNPSTKEFDDVKKAIEKTSPINIIKIERVQNPGLYKTYAMEKQKMDDKNGSNEKKLFHGTALATCQLINHQGFNRSFCGKNATCYGKGVYFARDASYSMRSTYSPPDAAGNRYMYLASVLAGEYTQGGSNMITSPPKNPNNPSVTYDTVVDNVQNPSIYVVFHDTQNYPDYLITFRCNVSKPTMRTRGTGRLRPGLETRLVHPNLRLWSDF